MAKAHTLSDNFNDNSTDTSKWLAFGSTHEVNQRLELYPDGLSKTASGYVSTVPYDLTGSSFKLEVTQTLRPVLGARTFFRALVTEDVNEVGMLVENGVLHCGQTVSGTRTSLASVPYEPARHLWWRLREAAGTLWWECSGDGQSWQVLHSRPSPIQLTAVKLSFGAGRDNGFPSLGLAIFDSVNTPDAGLPRRVEERRLSALRMREQAAELAAARPHSAHFNNNDEVNYPSRAFVGNFSKGLRHDSLGDPDPVSYGSLLRALESRDPADFEELLLGGAKKLTNPQAGLAFDLEAPDAQSITLLPAPRFDSEQAADEMGELYWMALARDVPFIDYATEATTAGSILQRAIESLDGEFPSFGGTRSVNAQNLFRGIYPGEQVGPYVSQFLLKGNVDPRKPEGQGRDAADGYITYGSQVIDQRHWTVKGFPELGAAADYLTGFSDWLAVQNGRDDRGGDQLDMTRRRFIRNLRDGANFVHFDQVVNAFYNAAFYLMSEPTGDQRLGNPASTGRPMVDMDFPFNPGNPYDPPGTAGDSRTQVGFTTFGPVHLLQVLIEVAGRAGRAVWWQKWGVHRRLRPEEYGGRVDNALNERRTYPFSANIRHSLSNGGLSPYFPERYGSYLLPQAYPEGAPTHPAYGAGHATIAGACATILKAFFDEKAPVENPMVASADGTALMPYTGADASQLTVGGELNKLAGNLALFRNAAGVHWRSDYTESLPLGEKVAIGLLREMSRTFNEDDAFFQLTKFDGTTVRIFDGCVEPVPVS
ncbi:vanadium-dependent haloperoxidase [Archangium sp. Cb G35]|uniref:vanadium-dependent haloperoxidase n=1 Tax=Archangium sp. Cb G35 TaxID=1920190 RepID=UPI000B130E25|nr:vanadium-dependent haloperoxidase [Archangium sp. Cb G35]